MRPPPIRRCLDCQNKTHKRFWLESKCPVCGTGSSYKESWHGGLPSKEIDAARQALTQSIYNIEGQSPGSSVERN